MSTRRRRGRPQRSTHVLRIIGGQWRGRRIPVLDRPGLRPTPDRVRETLFNWLGQDLQGWRCLDAFAGSGALGFEAASRGAASVVMVERDRTLVQAMKTLCSVLPGAGSVLDIRAADGLASLGNWTGPALDLVFLDPPFEQPQLLAPVLALAAQKLAPHGFVYLEAGARWPEADLQALGLSTHRQLAAGAVHAQLLQVAATPPAPA